MKVKLNDKRREISIRIFEQSVFCSDCNSLMTDMVKHGTGAVKAICHNCGERDFDGMVMDYDIFSEVYQREHKDEH